MAKYTTSDIDQAYGNLTGSCTVEAEFLTPHMGGQPASEDGIRAFVAYQMGRTNPKLNPNSELHDKAEFERTVKRIMAEEIREDVDTTPEGGEIKEAASYAVNVVRRDESGPYIGAHMIKACLKQAASRLLIFSSKRGSKGDVAEASEVRAWGKSLNLLCSAYNVHLLNADGKPFGPGHERTFERVSGRVHGPQGAVSIQTDTEVFPPGTRFCFEFSIFGARITEEDVVNMLAVAGKQGLGSVRSMERGKWRVIEAHVDMKARAVEEKATKKARKKLDA